MPAHASAALPHHARPVAARCLSVALLIVLVAACGGGGGADGAVTATVTAAAPTDRNKPAAAGIKGADGPAAATAVSSAPAPAAPLPLAADADRKEETPPAPAPAPGPGVADPTVLTVRARGDLAAGVGPHMTVLIDGSEIGSTYVQSTEWQDYSFPAPGLTAGSRIAVRYSNDAYINGEDRNLHVASLAAGGVRVPGFHPTHAYDRGNGRVSYGNHNLMFNGVLHVTWQASTPGSGHEPQMAASRFLQQASFGATVHEIERVQALTPAGWIEAQAALPVVAPYVAWHQSRQDQGPAYLPPSGSQYRNTWSVQAFWNSAVNAPDQLRHRTAFALQQLFTVSLADDGVRAYTRAHAAYLDTLYRHALGNYRQLLTEVALSPAMGLYLSHARNQPEDGQGRLPDENFARELMQLFTIGVVELHADGSPRIGADGQPIEAYDNDDVMAMARVFTGWSWGFDEHQLTVQNFRHGRPDRATTGSARVDIRLMKPYPGLHSPLEKQLFAGKPWGTTIAAGTPARAALDQALDTLFHHPNTAPFISRQLIQHLVSSNPSPGYVARVASAFANNGQGVRGDLAAVVRAILLDPEARPAQPGPTHGRLQEPVLRVSQLLRALDATSRSGQWLVAHELSELHQRPLNAPSVFGFYRPGYVPPNTALADAGLVAPEMQIANESTVAAWVNRMETLVSWGMGRWGDAADVTLGLDTLASTIAKDPTAALDTLDVLLYAGRMSEPTRMHLIDAMAGVGNNNPQRDTQRARLAVFLSGSSAEYLVQR